MNRFPMSIDLAGKQVLLIGRGEQIRQKAQKLAPFSPVLCYSDGFTAGDPAPAMVIVGDTPVSQAEQIYKLCCERGIPVNVVDVPRLCSFYFPALITRGDLTVSLSTAGTNPWAAAYLRQQIEAILPRETDRILDWLSGRREALREKQLLKAATAAAFAAGRPLTEAELAELERTR